MISGVSEVIRAKALFVYCQEAIKEKEIDFDRIFLVGCAIETPAAV